MQKTIAWSLTSLLHLRRRFLTNSNKHKMRFLSVGHRGRLEHPHEILGVGPNADKDDVKKAYFNLAKKWHPDVNKSEAAAARFARMTKAYNYLMSPDRGWDGDARADGVHEPSPPPGEESQSGPDWGGYHWAASFYGLGEESEFDAHAEHKPTYKHKKKPPSSKKKT
uniref:J domain-containing protein n=1 Tax=Lotharella globosa TaxID=91324 RepID=A0A7S3Z933_9EUKA|mmetsp:Transcript_16293/g.33045  ORF Transcript_16293/g.33045 Transcript_16293/m.33045 type:complete len:167 (+) Transcript_16293:28-528(+)